MTEASPCYSAGNGSFAVAHPIRIASVSAAVFSAIPMRGKILRPIEYICEPGERRFWARTCRPPWSNPDHNRRRLA